jgi:hypothetical protein
MGLISENLTQPENWNILAQRAKRAAKHPRAKKI